MLPEIFPQKTGPDKAGPRGRSSPGGQEPFPEWLVLRKADRRREMRIAALAILRLVLLAILPIDERAWRSARHGLRCRLIG
jgi:hypothetical protein